MEDLGRGKGEGGRGGREVVSEGSESVIVATCLDCYFSFPF